MTDSTELVIRGTKIVQDEHGFLCLTDIWRMSGEKEQKAPPEWRRLPTTRELIEALQRNLGKSRVMAKMTDKTVIYSKAGKGGGTFAMSSWHWPSPSI